MKNISRALALSALLVCGNQVLAAADSAANSVSSAAALPAPKAPLQPCVSVSVDAPSQVLLGKSTVVKLNSPVARLVVGGLPSGHAGKPVEAAAEDKNASSGAQQAAGVNTLGVADMDVMLLSPTELFLLGKRSGSMNLVLQGTDGRCLVKDLVVTIDPKTLQNKLAELMPEETRIKVSGAENALVLTGEVADSIKLDQALTLATAYGDGKKVVNLLRISAPQQVMLEVKIAEISKSLLDKLGSTARIVGTSGDASLSILTNLTSETASLLSVVKGSKVALGIDGQKDDGLVRILAEPNIMAISGQPASFLSGGRIFIPTARSDVNGIARIELTEKEFGIGVNFTPTVLDGGRVNLKMASEVSDLQQTGSPFVTAGGVVTVIPSFTVRKADTTVQLKDGQSFVVAGLIKNNVTETVKRFPGLGEIPIIGALFRSTEFKNDKTELIFLITPRLVKPLAAAPRLPTDNHVVPSRLEVYRDGALEGPAPAPAPVAPARRTGFAPPPAAAQNNK